MAPQQGIKSIAAELIVDLTPDEIDTLQTYLEFGKLGAQRQAEREPQWPPGPTEELTVSKPPAAPKAKAAKATPTVSEPSSGSF